MFTATFLTSLLCVFNKKSYLCIAFRKTLGLKHRFPALSIDNGQRTTDDGPPHNKVRLGAKPRMVNGQRSMKKQSGCSAVGSAPGLGPGGRPFESGHPDFFLLLSEKQSVAPPRRGD